MEIICILGRSRSGINTLESALEKQCCTRILSNTIRPPRGDECDGNEYHFVSREEFMRLVEKNAIMEYAEYSRNLYGAPKPPALGPQG